MHAHSLYRGGWEDNPEGTQLQKYMLTLGKRLIKRTGSRILMMLIERQADAYYFVPLYFQIET